MLDASLSNFQSLPQLAVAINITFTALLSVLGNSFAREQLRALRLLETGKYIRDKYVDDQREMSELRRLIDQIMALNRRAESYSQEIERVAFDRLRPLALVCAFISFCTLIYSTVFSGSQANIVVLTLSIACFLPLAVFLVWALLKARSSSRALRNERQQLDDRMQAFIDALGT